MNTTTATAASTEVTKPEDGFFLLGYWCNAYSRNNDRENFWMGPFFTRKEALDAGKRKQKYGQPKTFCDWGVGKNKVIQGVDNFVIAAKKVDLNPNVTNLYFQESY